MNPGEQYLQVIPVLIPCQSAKLAVLQDIDDKRVGILTGSVYDALLTEKYPKIRIFRFESLPYITLSLKTNKIDAALLDHNTATLVLKRNPEIGLLTDQAMGLSLRVGFNKKDDLLLKEFNEFLDGISNDGTLNLISERWLVRDAEVAEMPEFRKVSSGKKLLAGVPGDNLPYTAEKNKKYVGFDIELLMRFAERYGYELEIIPVAHTDLMASVCSGRTDLIAGGITLPEKNDGQVIFSDEYVRSQTAVIAPVANLAVYQETKAEVQHKSFLEKTINGINNNLIRDKMYLVMLQGLRTTFLISVFSAILGIIAGALICSMQISKNKLLRGFARTYITILRGIPLVVLLLVAYYVIFSSVNMNGVIVAIIAFGVNSSAYVSVMLKTSLESIDKGQTEAGIASGFSRMQTFILIILPQLLRKVLPVYKGEFVAIVKMTSVVGFIAVEDLTKASDIIRSRTFDAYSPLIIAAFIYFILIWFLTAAIGRIEVKVDPKNRRFMYKKVLEQ